MNREITRWSSLPGMSKTEFLKTGFFWKYLTIIPHRVEEVTDASDSFCNNDAEESEVHYRRNDDEGRTE